MESYTSPQLERLLIKAQSIRALESESAEVQLDAIVEYADLFQLFQDSEELTKSNEADLSALNERHTQVLRQAKALIAQVSSDMKELRTKGQALMKYIDVLPKKISSRRTRKG